MRPILIDTNAYTAFIDTTTLEVVAAFSYNNFQP